MQNYKKRLKIQELERYNEDRTLDLQLLKYLSEAQILSTRLTQLLQSICVDSLLFEISEIDLQYTVKISQTDIAAIIEYIYLLFQFSNSFFSSSKKSLQLLSLNIKDKYSYAQIVDNIFAEVDIFVFSEVCIFLKLINLFFVHINAWYSISYQKIIPEIVNISLRLYNKDNQILFYSIVATILQFYRNLFFINKIKAKQKKKSNKKILLYRLENSTVRLLQTIAIITLDRIESINESSA